MPNTSRLSLPYPLTTAAANIPADIQALADALAHATTGVMGIAGDETITGRKTFSTAPRHAVNAITATATISATAGKLNTFAGAASQTVTMPAAAIGAELEIMNINTTNTLAVTRAGSDTFTPNGPGATITTMSIPAGGRVKFICAVAGSWMIMPQNTPLLPAGTTQIGTAIPNPYDGMEVRVQNAAMLTAGVIWTFRYNAGGGTYKWEGAAGVELHDEVLTSESTTSATYVALTTAGPQVTTPLPGEYLVAYGFEGYVTDAGSVGMSYDIGGTGAVAADEVVIQEPNGASTRPIVVDIQRTRKKTFATTGTALVSKYRRITIGTAQALNRTMSIKPIRVS